MIYGQETGTEKVISKVLIGVVILVGLIAVALAGRVLLQPPRPTPTQEPKEVVGSNDWIIAESKKCTDAGMYPSQVMNSFTYKVNRIVCTPK